MGTAGRLAGLAVVACLGCSFDSVGGSGSAPGNVASGTATTGADPMEESTGSDEAGSGGADGTSVGGSTSVGSDESCVDACIPQAPAGWLGPYYAAEVANEIECPAGYDAQDVAYRGLEAPDADCVCSCDLSPGDCHVNILLSSSGCPLDLGLVESVTNGQCADNNALGFDVHARASLAGSPGSCTPNVVQTAAPPEWMTTVTLCAAPARGGDCGSDRCTATPPEGIATQACISKQGDHACPGGGYSARTLYHRSVNDARGCQNCTCDGPGPCEAQAFAHDSGSCNDSAQPLPLGNCVDIDVSNFYGVTASIAPESCTPSQASPAGEAAPAEPLTVCCVE